MQEERVIVYYVTDPVGGPMIVKEEPCTFNGTRYTLINPKSDFWGGQRFFRVADFEGCIGTGLTPEDAISSYLAYHEKNLEHYQERLERTQYQVTQARTLLEQKELEGMMQS